MTEKWADTCISVQISYVPLVLEAILYSTFSYESFNKNKAILKFHCEREGNVTIFEIDEKYTEKLPYGFNDINKWLENRRAPKYRTHIKELLEKCGCNDIEGFIKFSYCAGLNDTFWVKPSDIKLNWEDISLYSNEFDETIARIAFDGGLIGEKFSSATPELSTDGTFPKCWIRENDGVFLLKQGSSGASNTGKEPFSEMYAYELARIICDEPVKYDVVKYHGKIAAKCPLFTSEKISYAPFAYVMPQYTKFDDILKYYDSIGAGNKFRQMIVLDAITLNTDRHFKNFGVVYDADTLHVLDMAPVFDNNLSLCPFADITELKNPQKNIYTRECAFGEDFNKLALKCMTDDIKSTLINLRGFEFIKEHRYHLPKERLEALSNMVNIQIDNILNQRTIAMYCGVIQTVNLDNLTFSIKIDEIERDVLNELLQENLCLEDFNIITADGSVLSITNGSYMVNVYENTLEIEIFNADIKGNTENLNVINMLNIYMHSPKSNSPIVLKPFLTEIQLSVGNQIEVSELSDVNIAIISSEKFKKIEECAHFLKDIMNNRMEYLTVIDMIKNENIKKAFLLLDSNNELTSLIEEYENIKKEKERMSQSYQNGKIKLSDFLQSDVDKKEKNITAKINNILKDTQNKLGIIKEIYIKKER